MSKERVKQYRLRQKELGRLKREMYLTDSEFIYLKTKLEKLRNTILSCKNDDQLKNAASYCSLAYNILNKHIGSVNRTKFASKMERSIGYALCQIQNNKVN